MAKTKYRFNPDTLSFEELNAISGPSLKGFLVIFPQGLYPE